MSYIFRKAEKQVCFEDFDKNHADLKIRLHYDGLRQNEFFRLIELCSNRDMAKYQNSFISSTYLSFGVKELIDKLAKAADAGAKAMYEKRLTLVTTLMGSLTNARFQNNLMNEG